jgi:hypothetical protein
MRKNGCMSSVTVWFLVYEADKLLLSRKILSENVSITCWYMEELYNWGADPSFSALAAENDEFLYGESLFT